jgi:hypothetical protein
MIFSGLRFALSGFTTSEGTKLRESLEREGAAFIENFENTLPTLTHLIIFDEHGENLYKLLKRPAAETNHILIVTEHWVNDCMKLGEKITESPYLLQLDEQERAKIQENPLGVAIIPPHFFIGNSFYFHNYDNLFQSRPTITDIRYKKEIFGRELGNNPIESLIRRAGGTILTELPSNEYESIFVIAPYRDNFYMEVEEKCRNAKIRTIFWLADAIRALDLALPQSHPLHYPRPFKKESILENMVNYYI